jgi:uncharacterized membrane protein
MIEYFIRLVTPTPETAPKSGGSTSVRYEKDSPHESRKAAGSRHVHIAGGSGDVTDAISTRGAASIETIRAQAHRLILVLRGSRDLMILIASAVLLPILTLLPLTLVRLPLGIALVLFAPGYSLLAALLPRRTEIEPLTRIGLSFGLSIAIIPFIALALELMSIPIKPVPIVISLSVWILLLSGVALYRRLDVVPLTAPGANPVELLGKQGMSWIKRHPTMATAFLTGGPLLAVFLFALQLLSSPAPSTEFYVLGAQGEARDYPRSARVGEELTATVGIVNTDTVTRGYRIEVWAGDFYSAESEVLVAQSERILVGPEQNIEYLAAWQMPEEGDDQRVTFHLFRQDEVEPHRSLHLFLDVTGEERTDEWDEQPGAAVNNSASLPPPERAASRSSDLNDDEEEVGDVGETPVIEARSDNADDLSLAERFKHRSPGEREWFLDDGTPKVDDINATIGALIETVRWHLIEGEQDLNQREELKIEVDQWLHPDRQDDRWVTTAGFRQKATEETLRSLVQLSRWHLWGMKWDDDESDTKLPTHSDEPRPSAGIDPWFNEEFAPIAANIEATLRGLVEAYRWHLWGEPWGDSSHRMPTHSETHENDGANADD